MNLPISIIWSRYFKSNMLKMVRNIVRFACVCVVFGVSQSAIIDTLHKCPVKDTACHKELFQDTLSKIGEKGIPELDIPPLDPLHLENISLSVLNLVNITLVDGVGKGIKDCVFEEFTADFEKSNVNQKMLCDIEIEGNYKLSAASPLIESVLGGSEIHGEGKAKVKVDKLQIEFIFPFFIEKRDDGEIYIKCESDKIQRNFNILGKVSFEADNIFLGKEDVSELVLKYLNENWKFIMNSFGKVFYDKATEMYFNFALKFFRNIPTKNYISDDLTPYLKN